MNRTTKIAAAAAAILVAMTEAATAQTPVLIGFVDTGTRLAVRRAVQGAAARLTRPGCQDVLSELSDASGQPLLTKLTASGQSVSEAFRSLRFYDDRKAPQCRARTTLAFTQTGSRLIHVCGGLFKESFALNSSATEFIVIHEFLHALGLGENPPTSQEITERVARRCTAQDSEPRPTILLMVQNRCGVPNPILEAAQQIVTEIYARVRVDVIWMKPAPEPWFDSAGRQHLRVTLVSEGSEDGLLTALGVPKDDRNALVGIAPTATRTAYIFCRRVAIRARQSRMNRLNVALGRAIAHEVGHLLLPGQGHSETGIMRDSLDLRSNETAGFTDEEGTSIRKWLMSSSGSS